MVARDIIRGMFFARFVTHDTPCTTCSHNVLRHLAWYFLPFCISLRVRAASTNESDLDESDLEQGRTNKVEQGALQHCFTTSVFCDIMILVTAFHKPRYWLSHLRCVFVTTQSFAVDDLSWLTCSISYYLNTQNGVLAISRSHQQHSIQ